MGGIFRVNIPSMAATTGAKASMARRGARCGMNTARKMCGGGRAGAREGWGGRGGELRARRRGDARDGRLTPALDARTRVVFKL